MKNYLDSTPIGEGLSSIYIGDKVMKYVVLLSLLTVLLSGCTDNQGYNIDEVLLSGAGGALFRNFYGDFLYRAAKELNDSCFFFLLWYNIKNEIIILN